MLIIQLKKSSLLQIQVIEKLMILKQPKKEILRHELIHAFLVESGLNRNCGWHNEEMVDWLAIQFNKIKDIFKTCNI